MKEPGDAVFAVTERLVRDCAYLGTPIPQFLTRLGREALPGFDNDFITTALVSQLDPGTLYVHVWVPPEQGFATVSCDRSPEQLCVDLAERIQEYLMEGSMWAPPGRPARFTAGTRSGPRSSRASPPGRVPTPPASHARSENSTPTDNCTSAPLTRTEPPDCGQDQDDNAGDPDHR